MGERKLVPHPAPYRRDVLFIAKGFIAMSIFNITITIVGTLAGIVALALTFFLGRRSQQLPDIRYALDFDVIFELDDDLLGHDLAVTIGGHPVESLTRTRIAFWNQRGVTVRGSDIVEADPIRIEFEKDDEPLQVRTLASSRSQIALTADIDPTNQGRVYITFDFLDAKDGAVFEVIHQGDEPHLTGTLRGAKIRNHAPYFDPMALIEYHKKSPLRRLASRLAYSSGYFFGALLSIAVTLWLARLTSTNADAHLVNASHYDLHSMHGQANFSNAVFNSGNPYSGSGLPIFIPILLYAFAGILILRAIWLFYSDTRKQIPHNIASELARGS